MKIRVLFQIAFAFLCLAAIGCDAGVDGRYPISGTVQFGGEPLSNGQISFQPTGGGTALSSSAAQVIKGKFEIPASKGLVPGEYSVVLIAEEPSGQKLQGSDGEGGTFEYDEMVSYVPEDWGRLSKQKVTIEPKKNVFDFDVPRADAPVAEPEATGRPGGGA